MNANRLCSIAAALSLTVFAAAAALDPASLVNAAKSGDKAALRSLLKSGASVNAAQVDGTTALHWATYHDDLDTAGILIRAGANVNAATDLGVTPLWNASQNGSAPLVNLLLDAGANPSAALPSGETLVMTAARAGKAPVLELLIAKGADVNVHATRGQTALMWAVAQHHPDAVKVLLAHGANVNARTDVFTQLWQTSPQQDVFPGYRAALKMGGDTPLLFAARVGDLECARLLVAAGANVNDAAPYGVSATVLAAISGNSDLVEFLLDKDADPNAAGAGYTALHAAILRGNTKAVAALLTHGANPNAKLAASTPVRRDSQDYYFHPAFIGATPFWLAARYSEPDVMRLLAEHGADPLFVHSAEFRGSRTKTSDFALEKAGPTTALMAAVGLGRGSGFRAPEPQDREAIMLESAKIAVGLGVPVNAADAEGRTALETATALGYKSVIDYLVEHGAKLDRPARPIRREAVEN